MTEPTLDAVLRRAMDRVDDEDVRLFYAYFEELKAHARRALGHRARGFPGESHVAQSALVSLLCDAAASDVPLGDVDEAGYPMLWPLLLRYIERHGERWKKYFRAKKRRATEVPLAHEPAVVADDGAEVGDLLAQLEGRLTPRQWQIAALSAQGRTLAQTAAEVGISESLVSLEKKRIRAAVEGL